MKGDKQCLLRQRDRPVIVKPLVSFAKRLENEIQQGERLEIFSFIVVDSLYCTESEETVVFLSSALIILKSPKIPHMVIRHSSSADRVRKSLLL